MSRRKEYRLGVLSPTRIAAWHRMFTHLEQAADHRGSVAHISQTAVIDGVNIGHWVMTQRTQRTQHRQGRLTPDRAHALQALPGWDWALHTAHQQPGSTANLPPASDS